MIGKRSELLKSNDKLLQRRKEAKNNLKTGLL